MQTNQPTTVISMTPLLVSNEALSYFSRILTVTSPTIKLGSLMEADEDPENPDNVILFYSQRSIPKGYKVSPSNNDPDAWNREHLWPKSYGFSDGRLSAYADMHNLRPSDQTINGRRGNKWFGDVGDDASDPEAPENKYSQRKDLWEPRDEVKGDVARAVFYMAFRYSPHASSKEAKTPLMMNAINQIVHNNFGDAHDLAKWHLFDPPTEREIRRNDIAERIQGNRNPSQTTPNGLRSFGRNYSIQ